MSSTNCCRSTKIYGPPGTGKTAALLGRVLAELGQGVMAEQVAFVSFTRAAAHEARARAMAAFPDLEPEAFSLWSTIHSICYRLLGLTRERVFTGKRLQEFAARWRYRLSETVDRDEQELPEASLVTAEDHCEAFVSWWAHTMEPSFEVAFRAYLRKTADLPTEFGLPGLREYIARREAFKEERGLVDFHDMLLLVLKRGLCPVIDVLIGDELQDNSRLLMEVLGAWAKRAQRVYLGGDPEQAIFAWSGADPSLMMEYPADETIVLRQSHRCPVAVRECAMDILRKMRQRYEGDEFLPRNAQGEVRRAHQVHVQGRTFVLARTRRQLDPYYHELMDMGVPFDTLRGPRSPLHKAIGKVAATVLDLREDRAVPMPDMKRLARYVPARPWFRLGGKRDVEQSLLPSVRRDGLLSLGLSQSFKNCIAGDEFLAPLKATPTERDYLVRVARKYGSAAFREQAQVILSTIHGVKGAEADTVNLDCSLTRLPALELATHPDSERRVFYVAVTRAKETLVLLEGQAGEQFPLRPAA